MAKLLYIFIQVLTQHEMYILNWLWTNISLVIHSWCWMNLYYLPIIILPDFDEERVNETF